MTKPTDLWSDPKGRYALALGGNGFLYVRFDGEERAILISPPTECAGPEDIEAIAGAKNIVEATYTPQLKQAEQRIAPVDDAPALTNDDQAALEAAAQLLKPYVKRDRRALYDVLPMLMCPRLTQQQAADYVSVGKTKFRELVKSGALPQPINIGGRNVWDVRDLEEAVERMKAEQESARLAEASRRAERKAGAEQRAKAKLLGVKPSALRKSAKAPARVEVGGRANADV